MDGKRRKYTRLFCACHKNEDVTMRLLLLFFVVGLVVAASGCGLNDSLSNLTSSFDIYGRVISTETGVGVEGATVSALGKEVLTGPDGQYVLADLVTSNRVVT